MKSEEVRGERMMEWETECRVSSEDRLSDVGSEKDTGARAGCGLKHIIAGALLMLLVTLVRLARATLATAVADGLFASGALLCSIYALRFASAGGGFDIFSYSIRYIFRGGKDIGDYAMYTKRKRRPPSRAQLYVGIGLLLLSLPVSLLCRAA